MFFIQCEKEKLVNYIDEKNQKQGHWIITGKITNLPGYNSNQIVEHGQYINDKKSGMWKGYYPNGNLKHEITYVDGIAIGNAKLYYDNGNISDKGYWDRNKWVGTYKFYSYEGKLLQTLNYSVEGKRINSSYKLN